MSTPKEIPSASLAFAAAWRIGVRDGLKANGWVKLAQCPPNLLEEWTARIHANWEAQATAKVPTGKAKLAPMPKDQVDALYFVLCDLSSYNVPEMGKDLKAATALALNEIRRSTPKVDEAEIRRRAARYLRQFAGVRFTPPGLAKHWAACGGAPAPTKGAPAAAEPEGWRDHLRPSIYRHHAHGPWADVPAHIQQKCASRAVLPSCAS